MAEELKRGVITEEKRFIRGHGVNDFTFDGLVGIGFRFLIQIHERYATEFLSQSTQPGLQEIRFFFIEGNAGYLVDILG